ncbi:MAG TPA: transposase, partial [Nitrospira sp.]|nr:transposase [Nitrospira sp.]
MGEMTFEQTAMIKAGESTLAERSGGSGDLRVRTPGGRFQVRWDENGSASALGQLAFFAEFLDVSGLFERWAAGCPLSYTSNNAPDVRDVLGTWLLSILDGQRRYAHITGLRGDGVAPEILGMTQIISDESLRRALKHLAPCVEDARSDEERAQRKAQVAHSTVWMDAALKDSIREALGTDWILDCDTTVKVLYGHQAGAEIGYNPTKPGRPSHTIHTYWIANVRLVLDAEVQEGTATAAKYSLPRLIQILSELPAEQRPRLVRGDNAFGNEPVMVKLEAIEQPYLFKLRQTTGVKQLIERQWSRQDWRNVGQGFQAVEAELALASWTRARRVVVLRRAIKDSLVAEPKSGKREKRQKSLQFAEPLRPVKLWEYTVLVTNASYELDAIGQLYRDRADCENGFDELKNQWGWGGYTTQDLERCNLSARAVALIYNWWSWYVRLAHPKTRLEAITSRPLLLAGIARLTQHAGQSHLLLTITHAASTQVKAMIANVRKGLDTVRATAPQLTKPERWAALVRYIVAQIIAATEKIHAPPAVMTASLQTLSTG